MNRLYILLILISFCTSCSKPKDELTLVLKESLKTDELHDGTIIIVSENNCSSCATEFIHNYLIEQKLNKKIQGLIFRNSKYNHQRLEELKATTNKYVTWKDTGNLNLMKLLSKVSGKITGPYLILIDNGEISKIESLDYSLEGL